jgi:hypothetical protein
MEVIFMKNNMMVFESNEVEVIVVDDEVMFEVYSTGMALGYVTSNGYAYKKRIDKVLTNAEISTFSAPPFSHFYGYILY